jgi:ferric-dicitrate binding protein FerR (iron transport regulator)
MGASGEREEDASTSALEARLRLVVESPPDPAFVSGLRRGFLAAEGALEASRDPDLGRRNARMTRPEPPDLARVLDVPPARPAFQAELRGRFLRPLALLRTPRHRPWRAALGASVAAAAVAFVAATLWPSAAQRWSVRVLEARGPIVVDGLELAPGDGSVLAERLGRARTIDVGANRLGLTYGDVLEIVAHPGTTISALRFERDPDAASRARVMSIERGEIYLRTLAGFGLRPLTIETPVSSVNVTGTALGVWAFPTGACVCVAEGSVSVRPHDEALASAHVSARQSHVVFVDPAMAPKQMPFIAEPDPADPGHLPHVQELERFARL